MTGGSNPRIGTKLRNAIGHLVEGRAKTQAQAAQLASMSASQLSRALGKPHVQAFLLAESTRHLRGVPAALAAARLSKLINARSEDVSARVSTAIAKSAGLIAPDGQQPSAAVLTSGPVLAVVFNHVQPSADLVTAGAIAPPPDRIPARVQIVGDEPPVREAVAGAVEAPAPAVSVSAPPALARLEDEP